MEKKKSNERLELVVVFTSTGPMAAEMVQARLESAGIPAVVQNIHGVTAMGVQLGEVRVLVDAERASEARALLQRKHRKREG